MDTAVTRPLLPQPQPQPLPLARPAAPSLDRVTGGSPDGPDPRLMEAARGFEALMLQQMLQTAREASLGEGLFEGTGSDTTNGMFDRAISESGAERAGLGLADTIVRQLSPLVYRAGQGG